MSVDVVGWMLSWIGSCCAGGRLIVRKVLCQMVDQDGEGTMTQFPSGAQSLLRSLNERAVLECIDRIGSVTRADITGETGLSKPTVAVALATLAEREWIHETGGVTGRKGPIAALYGVRPEAAFAVGVNVGHESIKVNVADITGTVRAHRRAKLQRAPGRLPRQIERLVATTALDMGLDLDQISATVVGVPGAVGRDGLSLSLAAGLPGAGQELGHSLAAAMPHAVVLENDVNLATLAEHSSGVAVDIDEFILLGLGHGVGVGIVLGGSLYRGAGGPPAKSVTCQPVSADGSMAVMRCWMIGSARPTSRRPRGRRASPVR